MPTFRGYLARSLAQWIPLSAVARFGRPAALLFHGVEPRIEDARVQVVHHQKDCFRNIVQSLRANFDLLPLSALGDVLKSPERYRRALFLMADDGYANNWTIAADILDDYEIPWTLFVTTHHVDTREFEPLFLARLFVYFAPEGRYEIPGFQSSIVLQANKRGDIARKLVWDLRMLPPEKGKAATQAMLAILSDADLTSLLARFSSEQFLTWDQVRALQRRGVEIGAHGHWHWPLRSNSRAWLLEQAQKSRERIEKEIGPCRYFAYPFGTKNDISAPAWHAVRDAGFDYGFTTLAGTLDASRNNWLMPRYTIGLSERNVASMVPLLRAGNSRLVRWQNALFA